MLKGRATWILGGGAVASAVAYYITFDWWWLLIYQGFTMGLIFVLPSAAPSRRARLVRWVSVAGLVGSLALTIGVDVRDPAVGMLLCASMVGLLWSLPAPGRTRDPELNALMREFISVAAPLKHFPVIYRNDEAGVVFFRIAGRHRWAGELIRMPEDPGEEVRSDLAVHGRATLIPDLFMFFTDPRRPMVASKQEVWGVREDADGAFVPVEEEQRRRLSLRARLQIINSGVLMVSAEELRTVLDQLRGAREYLPPQDES